MRKSDDASCGAADAKFHTTQWTLVMAAAKGHAEGDKVVAEVCPLDWNPLYSFARRWGYSADDSQNSTPRFSLRCAAGDGRRGKSLTCRAFRISSTHAELKEGAAIRKGCT